MYSHNTAKRETIKDRCAEAEQVFDTEKTANAGNNATCLQGISSDDLEIGRRIVHKLFEKRRVINEPDSRLCAAETTTDFDREAEPHLINLMAFIIKREPIHLILPGFPAKSPNRNKTLGPLPDLADKYGLDNLHNLCQDITASYSPGAKLTICSDGRVFSDLVRIGDDDVTAYGEYLKTYAQRRYGNLFEFFDLNDVYPWIKDYDTLREELLVNYGESIRELRRRCNEQKDAMAMYLGITRFLFEDYSGLDCYKSHSRTAIQKIAKTMAFRVIQRSNAWTRLLEGHFPGAIRLSVHPQYRVSKKIGVYLGDSDDIWLTPWHAVAVKRGEKIFLCKRADAEMDGLLAFREGRPSHYELLEMHERNNATENPAYEY